MRQVLLLVGILLIGASGARAAEDWISREKIRAGWIYYGDGADKLGFFKQYGMNTLITSAGTPETFTLWAKEAKKAGMRLFGVVSASCDGEKAGMRRCVFGNGYESVLPCPVEKRYWDEVLIQRAVELAREGQLADEEISGILIDWEMYANSNKGGQIYYTDACYCDHCFSGFLKAQGQADVTGQVGFKERVAWLKEHKLAEQYQPYLQKQVREYAEGMRKAIAAVDPEFFVGFYPVPHNWHLVGVAQGLGTAEHPMILWATSTYGGGGPNKIADNWKQELLDKEIHCYYSAGVLLRQYTAANLAKNLYEVARKTDGYWIFTVHTLCIPEKEQKGDYHLCAGTPEEYLNAIKLADVELDKLGQDKGYVTPLQFVEEPVRYRHPGFDVERFKAPEVVDGSALERGKPLAVPSLGLIATSYMMMDLKAGEEPVVEFKVNKAQSGDVWGVTYAVLDPAKKELASGKMVPGEPFTLKFKAAQAGLHCVVVTPGYYGRCEVVSTTVPYANWTWSSYPAFEVAGPGGTLYFQVPKGMEEFTIDALCNWGTTQVQVTVLDPDGQVVVDQPTDQYVRNAKLKVATKGKDGRLWSLKVGKIEGKGFRSLQVVFDPKLPAWVVVRPDFVFEGK
ncbi:MAG: hypothetical protein ABFE08_19145 [Armatimonadia bacterium]